MPDAARADLIRRLEARAATVEGVTNRGLMREAAAVLSRDPAPSCAYCGRCPTCGRAGYGSVSTFHPTPRWLIDQIAQVTADHEMRLHG